MIPDTKNRLIKKYTTLGILFLTLALPITVFLTRENQDNRSSAATADKLEAEDGILSAGTSKQSDSQTSGGQFVLFSNTQSPTPNPTSIPATGDIVGYGKNTTGGTGGTITNVSNFAAFRTCAQGSGKRICKITGSGVWDGAGVSIKITNPNITIDGTGTSVILKDTWILVNAGEVIIKNIRVRTGDLKVDAQLADAISINGDSTAPISNIVIDHVEAIWGPDVGGITILSNVTDVTIQNTIIGVGLFRSSHPEAGEDADGHGMAMNITKLSGGTTWPKRITMYKNLLLHSQARNPAVKEAEYVDIINNVLYDIDEAPEGDPRLINVVNNIYRRGPGAELVGLGVPENMQWRYRSSDTAVPNSIYLSGNMADGYTFGPSNANSSVFRTTPVSAYSVTPESTTGLLDRVLSTVGPDIRDSMTNTWINDTRNRTGSYWNGDGFPAPNARWP